VNLAEVKPRFVPIIPEQLAEGVLYVCEPHRIAIHRCCCGCGEEVVTPLSPAEWQIKRNGSSVSLYPSIGNWNFRCQSHYWIRRNRVVWAAALSPERIAIVQAHDRVAKVVHIAEVNAAREHATPPRAAAETQKPRTVWERLWAWIASSQ
jgi:Family of unknown function (DUF6527)